MSDKKILLEKEETLPGRSQCVPVSPYHYVNGQRMITDFPVGIPGGMRAALFGMGCFWGAEKRFWQVPDVYITAVGYAGGYTENPSYEEVCSGKTNHAEVVLVVYPIDKVSFASLLKIFWESHDPTQGMQQGNDIGTQYRSAIYTFTAQQLSQAFESKEVFQKKLSAQRFPEITTDIQQASAFYYAEDHHQQYLAKNPKGYCGLEGTGVTF